MSNRAAFFDLDRTVIAGSSGVVLSRVLRESGVVETPKFPGEDALFRAFASLGENLPSMVLARQGVIALRDIQRHRVIGAAHAAIDELVGMVLPGAREAIERHRRNGERVVLATSTPHDLIAAFARRIGCDDVVATRFSVDEDDRYTGSLNGPFTWSAGKLAAVRTWCEEHDVSLDGSYAYSDSFYDAPLLEAVAYPHAVNPDYRLGSLAASRDWPVVTFNDLDPPESPISSYRDVQRAGLRLLRPELIPFVRFQIGDISDAKEGSAPIVVVNQQSRFDPVAIAMFLARNDRTARFLGPRDLFELPIIGWLAAMLGGLSVGSARDDESLEAAARSLEDGEMVVVVQRPGESSGFVAAARLAAITRSPIVPLVVTGSEEVWPNGQTLPSIGLDDPKTVVVRLGRSIDVNVTRDVETNVRLIAEAIDRSASEVV